MDIISSLGIKALVMIAISGCTAGLAIGVWLAVSPESFVRTNEFFSQWYSLRKVTKPLMVPRASERFFYRHHRPLGLAIVLGSVYVLYTLVFHYQRNKIIATFFASSGRHATADWLVPAAALSLGLAAIFTLVIGGFLVIRPSLLKGFEAWANKWVSARRKLKFLDRMRTGPDRFVGRRPRLTAGLLILGSGYALFRLSTFIQTVN